MAGIVDEIEREVSKVSPKKEVLRQSVEAAIQDSRALAGCRVEVVGSTSWGGAVPQSDLDLVLLTPGSEFLDGRDAVALLEELRRSLEARPQEARTWKQLEVLDAPRVPVLRIHEARLSCDVSVDQHRCLNHRTVMQSALKGRPEILSFIRLVKFWLRRRGLPMAAEGGLASLAWAVVALRLAEEQPAGSSVENLLSHFFATMHHLGEYCLSVEHFINGGARFSWIPRHATRPWADEWTHLLWVDDPTQPASSSCPPPPSAPLGITPPSIPAALAILYVAELRLAWKAIREGAWDDLWRATPAEVRATLPRIFDMRGRQAPLHIVLKNGTVTVGRLQEVRPCPSLQHQEVLHRRDQSSVLVLEPYKLVKEEPRPGGHVMITKIDGEDCKPVVCQPCHWICSLRTWNAKVVPGEGVDRLHEIMDIASPKETHYPVPVGAFVPVAAMCDVTQGRPLNVFAVAVSDAQGVLLQPGGQVAMVPVWSPQLLAVAAQGLPLPQGAAAATQVQACPGRRTFGQQAGAAPPPQVEWRRRGSWMNSMSGRYMAGQQVVPRAAADVGDRCPQTHSDESTRASESDDDLLNRDYRASSGSRGKPSRVGPRGVGPGPFPAMTSLSGASTSSVSSDKSAMPKGMLPAGRVLPPYAPCPPTPGPVLHGGPATPISGTSRREQQARPCDVLVHKEGNLGDGAMFVASQKRAACLPPAVGGAGEAAETLAKQVLLPVVRAVDASLGAEGRGDGGDAFSSNDASAEGSTCNDIGCFVKERTDEDASIREGDAASFPVVPKKIRSAIQASTVSTWAMVLSLNLDAPRCWRDPS